MLRKKSTGHEIGLDRLEILIAPTVSMSAPRDGLAPRVRRSPGPFYVCCDRLLQSPLWYRAGKIKCGQLQGKGCIQ